MFAKLQPIELIIRLQNGADECKKIRWMTILTHNEKKTLKIRLNRCFTALRDLPLGNDKKKMEVYTCDSESYVVCYSLAFLMLDLETSGLLYSAMLCTNQKNAFLICKSSVFIPYYQSHSSEKWRKFNVKYKAFPKHSLPKLNHKYVWHRFHLCCNQDS